MFQNITNADNHTFVLKWKTLLSPLAGPTVGGGLPLNICFPSTILIYKPQDRRTQSTLGWGGRRWTGAWGWKAGATSTPPPTPLLPLLSSLSYPPSPPLSLLSSISRDSGEGWVVARCLGAAGRCLGVASRCSFYSSSHSSPLTPLLPLLSSHFSPLTPLLQGLGGGGQGIRGGGQGFGGGGQGLGGDGQVPLTFPVPHLYLLPKPVAVSAMHPEALWMFQSYSHKKIKDKPRNKKYRNAEFLKYFKLKWKIKSILYFLFKTTISGLLQRDPGVSK